MGKGSGQTIGYKYYMGVHMVVCHGPVDEVQAIIVGEREAWGGQRYGDGFLSLEGGRFRMGYELVGSPHPVTSNETIFIYAPTLFGGPKKEGGIQGNVDIMMGGPTQLANPYLVSKLGTPMPAFRGVLSLVLNQVYVSAMSPYPKPWAVRVKRLPGKTWYAAKADINNGSANPIHVIYETLTNPDWGMGYPPGALDDAAFRTAADTCYAEGLGVSLMMTKQDAIESFIHTILGHCNGMIYTRTDNGQFVVKLLRDDYVLADQPLFDESNTVKLTAFERPGYSEVVNEVIVQFRPRGTDKDDSVTVQDLAAIQAQQGIISQTMQYPGIDTAENAGRLAMRDLRQKSTPLARLQITVNRDAWDLNLGEVFRFSWAEHDLVEVAMRVLGMNYGDLDNGEIMITAAEDIFGLPSSTYLGTQPPLWTDPIQTPNPLTMRRLEEVPYWDLAMNLTAADLAQLTSSSAFLSGVMGKPTQYLTDYELWTRVGAATYDLAGSGPVADHALLLADVPVELGPSNITLASFTSQEVAPFLNTYGLLDDEVVCITAWDPVAGTATIKRGCLDTIPALHVAGTRFWLAEEARAFDPTEYASGTTVNAKALPRNGTDALPIASATEDAKLLTGRQARPYPPGAFKLMGVAYPTAAVNGALTVDAKHRDRTQQQVRPLIGTEAGNIGPEVGTTYRIDVYASNGTTVLHSETGITAFPWSWTAEATENVGLLSNRNRIKLTAQRDGLDSYQSHDWYVDRAGLGNNLGTFLGGV